MEFILIQYLVELVCCYAIMFGKKRAPNYITFWGGSLGLLYVGLMYGFLSNLVWHNCSHTQKGTCIYRDKSLLLYCHYPCSPCLCVLSYFAQLGHLQSPLMFPRLRLHLVQNYVQWTFMVCYHFLFCFPLVMFHLNLYCWPLSLF